MPHETELVDIQVNGYAGVDFNADDLSLEAFRNACREIAASGVALFLPTIITADIDKMVARLERLVDFRRQLPEFHALIIGWHVEGPFISSQSGYVGAHPAEATCPASVPLAGRLLEAGGGLVRLVTLAPEVDANGATTRRLVDSGVAVSAGHCNPSIDQLKQAIDQGLTMFTHLGNGCPLELPRHDNIIQRVLALRDHLWICFIADGVHVPYLALGNYLAQVGPARAIVTSDAIAAAGKGPGEYTLGNRRVRVDQQLATWSADGGHLVGSATPLPKARQNLIDHVHLSPEHAFRLVSENPRRALGLE
jgi:N-acetylglucosamine-6-phosphate deacetylase